MMKTSDEKVKAEFEQNRYVVIPNGISPAIVKFIDYYIEVFTYRYETVVELLPAHYNYSDHGHVNKRSSSKDRAEVAWNSFNNYGNMITESLLLGMRESIGRQLGLELVPTYSYFRIYTTGNKLDKHIDRPPCEISMTLCLSRDGESWPIFIEGTPVYHDPGDLVVYRGCEMKHWRESFKGTKQTQMFLHYNDKNGPHGEDYIYDGRPFLGLPGWTRNGSKDLAHRRG